MPVVIPQEILPMLAALGIVDPTESHWQRKEAWPIRRTSSHYFCQCRPPQDVRVNLIATHLAGRSIFIGQCPHCGTIYWRDAMREN